MRRTVGRFLSALLVALSFGGAHASDKLKIGVVGLTHTHVHWIFESEKQGEFEIVGIVEQNKDLARSYAKQHNYSMDKEYDSLDDRFA